MKTIFEAYKKRMVGLTEVADRLRQVGNLQLYPPPHESQQEEFSRLCLRLLNLKKENLGSMISVASSASGEGSSFISYTLAIILGLIYEQKVAWIDGNFHSPQRMLMDHEGPTFADMLRDPEQANNLAANWSQVTLVPGGYDLRNQRAKFTDNSYIDLLINLSNRFDFVIIDLPPVQATQDAALMAKRTDGLLLVVAHRRLKRETIKSGVQALLDLGVNILGAVLNRRQFDLPRFLHNRV